MGGTRRFDSTFWAQPIFATRDDKKMDMMTMMILKQ